MSRLRILKNPVDGDDEVLHIRTDKVLETFIEVKKKSPQARIFLQPACQQNDVTPSNKVDEASLQMLAKTNDFDVVCEAGEPLTIFLVVTAVLSAGLAIYTYLNMPDVPQMNQKSGNNELSNRVRIGVADVQLSGSTNVEANGVITIGSAVNIENPDNFKGIQIDTLLIQDDLNGLLDLAGRYAVSSILKSGSFAYEIALINPVSVNPNWALLTDDNLANSSTLLTNNSNSVDISGNYTNITAVTSDFIELTIPTEKQSEWDKLNGIAVNNATIELRKYTDNWLGWFYINSTDIEKLLINFYFPKGLFGTRTDGKDADGEIKYEIEYQQLINNSPIGSIYRKSGAKYGLFKSTFGISENILLPTSFAEGVRVRVRKTSQNTYARSAVYDEIKLKSVYACSHLKKLVYPDVTLVRSQTVATDGALSVKERQWNCIGTQKLYSYASGARSLSKQPTNDFADIVTHITLDPLIGRRELSDLDVQGVYATSQEIKNYFGTPLAAHFNYTFDQGSQSFEEALAQIASCVGSNARREGSQIYFQFEKENPNSSILFNHRNKRPFTETRSEKYGVDRDHDGVEVTWIDPADGWVESIIRLPDEFITNPKKLELSGVTNKYQAHFLAHRAWNKIQYQREMVKFTAYGEADLVSLNDRIAVVDVVVPTLTSSGDITYWQGQNISISQPVELDPTKSYTIHLQHLNRSVETMLVTQGVDEYSLVLERLPVLPLVVKSEYDEYAKYSITLSTEKDSEAFLITEKSHSGPFESEVTAINYDTRYYSNDKDYINNLI